MECSYDYLTADGAPYMRANRYRNPKDFRQLHWTGANYDWGAAPEGPKIPYRLPEVLAAVHDTVFVVEGEKDADNLAKHDLVATTNIGGAGNWHADMNKHFAGKKVFILPDNDDVGAKHAADVARHLCGVADSVRIVNLPGLPYKGDVSDWLANGGDPNGLVDLCEASPVWTADTNTSIDTGPKQDCGLISVRASDVEMRALDWLWPDRFAYGKLGLLVGLPDEGKGQILADIAARITTGASWPFNEGVARKGKVVILTAEDDPADTVVPRLKAAGADLDMVEIVLMVKDGARQRMFDMVSDLKSCVARCAK